MATAAINQAASLMGRKGGSVSSAAKAKASRKNGKLGGRPKQEKGKDTKCISR